MTVKTMLLLLLLVVIPLVVNEVVVVGILLEMGLNYGRVNLIHLVRGESTLNSSEKLELKFECQCDDKDDDDGNKTIIEGVKILSTSKVDDEDDGIGIRFDVENAVRSKHYVKSIDSYYESKEGETGFNGNIFNKAQLKIRSVLVCTCSKPSDDEKKFFDSKRSFQSLHDIYNHGDNSLDNIFLAKQALDMGVNCVSP